ncbi:MAG: TRAP transporter small permease subunit [Desulfobacteraceae bacterium]|jgi:TRAP-type mannitol/chloroaromatic compound transport system permease small subunit|nr:MAG: TRAP transporter small permease subunit [Desulfobacteraceae bacterium]
MNNILNRFLAIVETVNTWIGKGVALLIPVIMLIMSYEVIMRYIFKAPTIWAWDINAQLFAMVVFLGGGYTLLQKGHVSIDVIYAKLSTRMRAILDLVTCPVFFIFFIILTWKMTSMTIDSIEEREVLSTVFAPPIYPLKVLATIGTFLLLMQGIAKFIRDLQTALSKNV